MRPRALLSTLFGAIMLLGAGLVAFSLLQQPAPPAAGSRGSPTRPIGRHGNITGISSSGASTGITKTAGGSLRTAAR